MAMKEKEWYTSHCINHEKYMCRLIDYEFGLQIELVVFSELNPHSYEFLGELKVT